MEVKSDANRYMELGPVTRTVAVSMTKPKTSCFVDQSVIISVEKIRVRSSLAWCDTADREAVTSRDVSRCGSAST